MGKTSTSVIDARDRKIWTHEWAFNNALVSTVFFFIPCIIISVISSSNLWEMIWKMVGLMIGSALFGYMITVSILYFTQYKKALKRLNQILVLHDNQVIRAHEMINRTKTIDHNNGYIYLDITDQGIRRKIDPKSKNPRDRAAIDICSVDKMSRRDLVRRLKDYDAEIKTIELDRYRTTYDEEYLRLKEANSLQMSQSDVDNLRHQQALTAYHDTLKLSTDELIRQNEELRRRSE